MDKANELPQDRIAVGQLLVRLLREFRLDLLSPAEAEGYGDLRLPHLQIFGNMGIEGIRLTQLAGRAQRSLAATSELVNELQEMGYLERREDSADRRAKLIYPTTRGREAMDDAGKRVSEIEQRWASVVGPEDFGKTCATLQRLLDHLTIEL